MNVRIFSDGFVCKIDDGQHPCQSSGRGWHVSGPVRAGTAAADGTSGCADGRWVRDGGGQRRHGMSQRWVLRPEPESAGAARVLVRSVCSEWGVEGELREDALLIVNELVSNVVDHAGTRCVLSVGVDDGELRIEVRDFYRCQPPRPRRTDLRSRRGRGLQLVSLLSARWGVTEFAGFIALICRGSRSGSRSGRHVGRSLGSITGWGTEDPAVSLPSPACTARKATASSASRVLDGCKLDTAGSRRAHARPAGGRRRRG